MNKSKLVLAAIFPAMLFLASCAGVGISDGGSAPRDAENTSFYQHWIHSYEDQNGQKIPNIFRPAGSRQFPPSKFRMEFAFDKSGECNYKFLSPVDRHEMRNCVFTKIGNQVYLYDMQGKSLSHLFFTINSANKDIMKMSYGVKKPAKKVKKKGG